MSFLYNIFIIVYKFGIGILSVFDEKTKQIVTAQKDLKTRIYNATKNHENIVWFHASSLGEFEQAKSVIKLYGNENPTHKILLTFYSPSGYNIVKNPVHVHDLQATILNQFGIDHERMTYKFQGRRFRLTDVHGEVKKELLDI